MSNIAGIIKSDIADGPGVRVGVFLSGCPHHCPGCFNQELWDYNYGKPFDADADVKKIAQDTYPKDRRASLSSLYLWDKYLGRRTSVWRESCRGMLAYRSCP